MITTVSSRPYLPGGDGLDILRAIRKKENPAGVIIISAKDSLDDRLKGLEIGADDYIGKPLRTARTANAHIRSHSP